MGIELCRPNSAQKYATGFPWFTSGYLWLNQVSAFSRISQKSAMVRSYRIKKSGADAQWANRWGLTRFSMATGLWRVADQRTGSMARSIQRALRSQRHQRL